MAVTPDGSWLASVGAYGAARVFDPYGNVWASIRLDSQLTHCVVNPKRPQLVVAGSPGVRRRAGRSAPAEPVRRAPPADRFPVTPRPTSLLAVAMSAVLAGASTFAAIADWAAGLDPPARHRLGLTGRVPAGGTVWRFLVRVDATVLQAVPVARPTGQAQARRDRGGTSPPSSATISRTHRHETGCEGAVLPNGVRATGTAGRTTITTQQLPGRTLLWSPANPRTDASVSPSRSTSYT